MPYKTWAEAFFYQAVQDFSLACLGISSSNKYSATILMLLQMFFEKYAKAVYCRSTHTLPKRNHKTTSILRSALERSPKYKKYRKLNSVTTGSSIKPYVDFFDFLSKLESLQPSNANHGSDETIGDTLPQLEYPWKETAGNICSPCTDLDFIHEIENPQSRIFTKVLPIAQNLINDFPVFLSTGLFPAK